MKEFCIGKNESGQRLDKYLRKLLPEASDSFLYKMLRKKNIVLNSKKSTGAERLAIGDLVRLYLSDETFDRFCGRRESLCQSLREEGTQASGGDVEVLYENADILVINKPAGMLSQKARATDISANEKILQYLLRTGAVTYEELATFRPSVCNRLDKNTSGILIAGKTLSGLQQMSEELKQRTCDKYYRCITAGVIKEPEKMSGYLCKDHRTNRVQIIQTPTPDSQYIETEYTPIRHYDAGYTLLEVHLLTGRSHQIRAHLSSVGHPIVGDTKYGLPRINRQFSHYADIHRQLLHACRLVLADGTTICAPLPEDFQRTVLMLEDGKLPFSLRHV